MKLASTKDNRALVIDGDDTYDVTEKLPLPADRHGGPWLPLFESDSVQEFLNELQTDQCPTVNVDEVQLAAPLTRPGKIIAAPVNYIDHKVEMAEQKTIAEYGIFLKANTSVIGQGDIVEIPYRDKRTDQEGEFAIVIGQGGSNISREDALGHVFGYTASLDITVRSTEDRSTRKSFDTFTPLGPWIVTKDEIDDPDDLDLKSWVDGELRQETNTAELIFDTRELIAYASSVMTLRPGDVILTGTPAGVGPISGGSPIKVTVEGIGSLEVTASDQNAINYADRPGARFATSSQGK